MGRIYQQGRLLRDEHGQPILDENGKPKKELRSKNWWIHYYDANGKAHYETCGSTKKGDAERLLRLREGAKERGEPVGSQVGRVTFDDGVQDVINDYTTNGRKSLDHVKRRFEKHLKPAFGGRRMSSLTTADVRTFTAARLEAEASAAEINRELAIVKRAFTLAIQAGKLLHRPHIPMLRENNVRTGFFERHEFEAVRANLPAHLQPIVTLAYTCGWRVMSEILPLRVGQVDLQASVVRLDVGTTKNNRGRQFNFGAIDEIRKMFAAQVASAESLSRETSTVVSHVFHEPTGVSIDQYHFRLAWKAATTAAGCPGKLLHDFRRSAVRNLVRAGVSETTAMKITGHKTRSVFDRYDITSEGDLNDAAAKLGDFLTSKPKDEKKSGRVRQFKRRA